MDRQLWENHVRYDRKGPKAHAIFRMCRLLQHHQKHTEGERRGPSEAIALGLLRDLKGTSRREYEQVSFSEGPPRCTLYQLRTTHNIH